MILNHEYPFNLIQPTTENIAMCFFNRLDQSLNELGLSLEELDLWGAPTRGS